MIKYCSECSIEISVYSRYCEFHSKEKIKIRDRARKRQLRKDGNAYALVRESQIRQREEKKQWLCGYLTQHPCVDCGNSDIRVLEFDHIGSKTSNISRLLNNCTSWKRLQEEINNCEVRCANCHRIKTVERMGGSYKTKYLALVSAQPPTL